MVDSVKLLCISLLMTFTLDLIKRKVANYATTFLINYLSKVSTD